MKFFSFYSQSNLPYINLLAEVVINCPLEFKSSFNVRLHLQEEGQSWFVQMISLIEYFRVPPQWDSGSVSHAISVISHTLRYVILKVMHGAEALIFGNLILQVAGLLAIYYRPPTKSREDNVFTPVCHSVHRGAVWGHFLSCCLVPWSFWWSLSRGGLTPEGVSIQGSLSRGGVSLQRGCLSPEGVSPSMGVSPSRGCLPSERAGRHTPSRTDI